MLVVVVVVAEVLAELGLGLVISERLVLIPSGAPAGRDPPGLPPKTGGVVDNTGGVVTFATGGVVCFGGVETCVGFGVAVAVLVLGFFAGA